MLQKGGRGIKLDGTVRDQTNTYLPLASIEFSISASVVFGVCSQIILWPPSGCTANLIGFSFSSEAASTSINSSSARFGTLAYRTLKVLSSIYGKFGNILINKIMYRYQIYAAELKILMLTLLFLFSRCLSGSNFLFLHASSRTSRNRVSFEAIFTVILCLVGSKIFNFSPVEVAIFNN